ncbi:MAG: 2-C-methyl-D-erythritol 4-phosphate cytidylyltransferase [Lachnospiraceae bacterium]|nr:2-C-methyl-D-erythritol 4-phosphate cytidylyltransferase [Lachnospiraceae bacterium]
MRHCVAVLLSGGTGTRLGAEIPKQYIRTGGRMMITRSLHALFLCPQIEAVQIVADAAWHSEIAEDWKAMCADGDPKGRIAGFSAPGETRQLSILNGLEDIAVQYGEDTVVLVHDAARPFVSVGMLEKCITACADHDGAMPVLPMKDTVYYSDNGRTVTRLLERECIYAGQAPEAFVLGKYLAANRTLLPERILLIKGSTEPAVMAGMDIAMIPGEESNFKVTTRADLERYETIVMNGGKA